MKYIRKYIFKILYKLHLGNYLSYLNKKNYKAPILVFHKIIPEYDEIWPGVHPKLFDEIITLLKKHYQILPISDLLQKKPEELKNACFISFDDGYKDFLDYAYPILKKHKAHSTLFILPNKIYNEGHIWTSRIIFFVKHYSFNEIDAFFKKHNLRINYTNPANPFRLNLDITVYLCELPQNIRRNIILELQEKFILDGRIVNKELLSFEELRKLNPDLVSIASHSLTHPSFKNEYNEEFINNEIKESKAIIEKELNTKINSFSFPFAKYNDVSLSVVKKTYAICFTSINSLVSLKKIQTDKEYIYDLPRFNVHHDSAEEVFFLINGFHKKLGK